MKKRIVFGAFVVALTMFLGAGGTGFAQVDVTGCGQWIPRGQTGELTQDLTCPDTPMVCSSDYVTLCSTSDDCPPMTACVTPPAVYLERGATLNMNGYTIESEVGGVFCSPPRCAINGPGVIRGGGDHRGVWMPARGTLEISNVLIEGWALGLVVSSGRVYATGLTVQSCGWGMVVNKLRGNDITVNDNDTYGIWLNPHSMVADNVTVNGNGGAGIPQGYKVKGSNITANFNGDYGIGAYRIMATGVETKGNATWGLLIDRRARITGLVSMDNGGPGLESQGSVTLLDSALSDNDTSGDGIDILSTRQPRLSNTTCSRSERTICEPRSWNCSRTGESWGVCSLD